MILTTDANGDPNITTVTIFANKPTLNDDLFASNSYTNEYEYTTDNDILTNSI